MTNELTTESMVLDFDGWLGGQPPEVKTGIETHLKASGANAEREKKRLASMFAVSQETGLDLDTVDDRWDDVRGGYAEQMSERSYRQAKDESGGEWMAVKNDDDAFGDQMKKAFQQRKDFRSQVEHYANAGLEDALTMEPQDFMDRASRLTDIFKSNSTVGPEDAKKLRETYILQRQQAEGKLGPLRPAAKEIYDMLGTGKTERFGDAAQANIEGAIDKLAAMPDDQRGLVLSLVKSVAPNDDGGNALEKSVSSAIRGLTGQLRGFASNISRESILAFKAGRAEIYTDMTPEESFQRMIAGKGPGINQVRTTRKLTGEESQRLKPLIDKALTRNAVAGQVIGILEGTIDPIKSSGIMDDLATGVGSSLGAMAPMAIPYAGVVIAQGGYADEEYQRLLANGVAPETAHQASQITGAIQAAVERVAFLFNFVPSSTLGKLSAKMMATTPMLVSGKLGMTYGVLGKLSTVQGAEYTEEIVQAAAPAFTAAIAPSLGINLPEQAQLTAELNRFQAEGGLWRPDVYAVVAALTFLPSSAQGVGSTLKAREYLATKLADPDYATAMGIKPEQAIVIAAMPREERIAAYQESFSTRDTSTPVAAAAAAAVVEKAKAAAQQGQAEIEQAAGEGISIRRTAEGWDVVDENSGTTLSHATADEAMDTLRNTMYFNDVHRQETFMNALGRYTGIMREGRTITLSEKEGNLLQELEDASAAGRENTVEAIWDRADEYRATKGQAALERDMHNPDSRDALEGLLVLGRSSTEAKGNAAKSISLIMQDGRTLDLVEEQAENDLREAVMAGTTSVPVMKTIIQRIETATGDKYLVHDSETGVMEAWAKLVRLYTTGTKKGGNEITGGARAEMASDFRALRQRLRNAERDGTTPAAFKKMREYLAQLQSIMGQVSRLMKARDAGHVDDLEAMIRESVGLKEQDAHEAAVVEDTQAKYNLPADQTDPMTGVNVQGYSVTDRALPDIDAFAAEGMSFSLRPADQHTLREVLDKAQQPGTHRDWAELPLPQIQRQQIEKQSGLSLEGYRRIVDVSAIKHAEKAHGTTSKDSHPLTDSDLQALPEIMAAPGVSGFAPDTGRNTPRIAHVRYHNGWFYHVEEIRTGAKALALVTLRKGKSASLQTNSEQAGSFTSETILEEANQRLNRMLEDFKSKRNYSITTADRQRDAEYMAAVESGDVAKQQSMVDEAAKTAGFKSEKVTHITSSEFTVFDRTKFESGDVEGFYFAGEAAADTWGSFTGGKKKMQVFLRMNNPVEMNVGRLKATPEQNRVDLQNRGYDGVVDNTYLGNQYIVFDPNQIKSADPITRDESGNVIPLSERFNPAKDSISYSIASSSLSVKPPAGVKAIETDSLPIWDIPKDKDSLPKLLSTPAHREKFFARLDKALEYLKEDPIRITTADGWVKFLQMAGVSGQVTMPPSGLAEIISDPAAYIAKLKGGYHGKRTLPGSQESAKQGLDGTREMRRLIGEGKAPAMWSVALHHMWGILSRMLPPLQQEGMWLRLIAHRPVLDAIQSSIDGKFALTQDEWAQLVQDARAASVEGAGQVGNAATANANSFHMMLNRLNGRWQDVADVYAEPDSRQMGRKFWALDAGALGIKNKVQRFIGLTFGVPGVIMDRWKFVEFWLPTAMEGMGAATPADFFRYGQNTPSDPTGIYGVYGGVDSSNEVFSLAMYEAFETVLDAAIEKSPELQKHLGPNANPGGMHWHGWNAIKNEAVGHSSLNLTKDLQTAFGVAITAADVYNTLQNGTYFTEGAENQRSNLKFILERGTVRTERTSIPSGLQPGSAGTERPGTGGGDGKIGRGSKGTKGSDSYSITTADRLTRVADRLDKLARDPDQRLKMMQRGADELRGMARSVAFNDKAYAGTDENMERRNMLRWLSALDTILMPFPPEVRAKVGGFVKLASLRTNRQMETYLRDRVDKLDKVMEKHLQAEYREAITDIFTKAEVKVGQNRVPKGKLTPGTQTEIDKAKSFANLSIAEAEVQTAAAEAVLSSPTTDQAAYDTALENMLLLHLFGGALDDGKGGMLADNLMQAHKWLLDTYKQGRSGNAMLAEALKQQWDGWRGDVITHLGAATSDEAADRINKDKGPNPLRFGAEVINGLFDIHQQLADMLGENHPLTQHFSTAIRHAREKARWEVYQEGVALYDWMKTNLGIKSKARQSIALSDLSRQVLSPVSRTVGKKMVTDEISIDLARQILDGTVTDPRYPAMTDQHKALGEALRDYDAALAAHDANPKGRRPERKFLAIDRVTDPGVKEQRTMSMLDAINDTLLWQQDRYKEANMERHGLGKDYIAEVEAWLTPEAKSIRDFIRQRYGAEYDGMNKTFRALFNVDMPQEKNYARAGFNVGGVNTQAMGPNGLPVTPSGMSIGSIKGRIAHTAEPKRQNALALRMSHVAQISHWKAAAEVGRDLRAVFTPVEVRDSIVKAKGAATYNRLMTAIETFEAGGWRDGSNNLDGHDMIQELMGTGVANTLGANIGSLLAQVPAALVGMTKLGPVAWSKAAAKLVANPSLIADIYRDEALVLRRGPVFSRGQIFAALSGKRGNIVAQNIVRAGEMGVEVLGEADAALTAFNGAVAYLAHLEKFKSVMPLDQAKAMALDKMRETIEQTGQPEDFTRKSNFENQVSASKGLLMLPVRGAFMFKSAARAASANFFLTLKNADLTKQQKAGRLAALILVVPIMEQVMRSLWKDLTSDDPDEELWSLKAFLASMATAPAQGVPGIGSIQDLIKVSWFGGFTVTNQDPATRLVKESVDATKKILKDGKLDINSVVAAAHLTSLGLSAFGVPGGPAIEGLLNLEKSGEGAVKNAKTTDQEKDDAHKLKEEKSDRAKQKKAAKDAAKNQ